MRVWRVAHDSLTFAEFPAGPYVAEGISSEIGKSLELMYEAHNGGSHPSPARDPEIDGIHENERCGFTSEAWLYTWFSGFMDELWECDFIVYVYEVPDYAVRVGQYGQAVFPAWESTLIRTEQLDPPD